ncbi:SIR2 family NAD-dependent protein deacylase [Segnochrobactraceae bacterium EtOH-i3]
MRVISDLSEGRRLLAELFGEAEAGVVFTGAGISTESGIPDFRSPGGIWSRMKPILFQEFVESEAARLEDWRRRFMMRRDFLAAEPNDGHRAVSALVAAGRVETVITQNIDGLHQRSGVPEDQVVELHGTVMHAHCLECGEAYAFDGLEEEIARTGRSPRCPECGGFLKSAIINFGEAMPPDAMLEAERASRTTDLFVAVGSSLVVYPAASFPLVAKESGATLVIVNREPTALDDAADYVLLGGIGDLFRPLAPSQ